MSHEVNQSVSAGHAGRTTSSIVGQQKRSPIVVLVETPKNEGADLSTASAYGRVETIFGSERVAGRPTTFEPDRYSATLLTRLDALGFDPDVDFLAVVGGMLTVGIAMAAVAARYGRMRLLVYNSSMGKYLEKDFEVGNTTQGDTRWRGMETSSLSPALNSALR